MGKSSLAWVALVATLTGCVGTMDMPAAGRGRRVTTDSNVCPMDPDSFAYAGDSVGIDCPAYRLCAEVKGREVCVFPSPAFPDASSRWACEDVPLASGGQATHCTSSEYPGEGGNTGWTCMQTEIAWECVQTGAPEYPDEGGPLRWSCYYAEFSADRYAGTDLAADDFNGLEVRICEERPTDEGAYTCTPSTEAGAAAGTQVCVRPSSPLDRFPADAEVHCASAATSIGATYAQVVCTFPPGTHFGDDGGDLPEGCVRTEFEVSCSTDTPLPTGPFGDTGGSLTCTYADEFTRCVATPTPPPPPSPPPPPPSVPMTACTPGQHTLCDGLGYCGQGIRGCDASGNWTPCYELTDSRALETRMLDSSALDVACSCVHPWATAESIMQCCKADHQIMVVQGGRTMLECRLDNTYVARFGLMSGDHDGDGQDDGLETLTEESRRVCFTADLCSGCSSDADCGGGFCAFDPRNQERFCTFECDEANPCPSGFSCVGGGGYRVCQPSSNPSGGPGSCAPYVQLNL